jgi:primosomal protein N' (replication factor Y) (superfamily II helicase)
VYARVVVDVAPAHLDHPFDYRVPEGAEVAVGRRVQVTFAGRRRVGWVVGTADEPATDPARVRDLLAVDGDRTWFDAEDLPLYRWVADRWAGTLADVLRHAMPARIASEEARPTGGSAAPPPGFGGAARRPDRSGADERWAPYDDEALRAALDVPPRPDGGRAFWLRALADADVGALVADLVARTLRAGRSALVLVPDPATDAADAALGVAAEAAEDLRGATDRARYRAFLRGRHGAARLVVGERGAALWPLRDLGLVVVADEANPAYKERRAPRHHAREVALARARRAGATCVLLGDLPSANLHRLVADGHVSVVAAGRAEERGRAPRVVVVDRDDPDPTARRTRLSERTTSLLAEVVRAGGAVAVVAARGGVGAALACQRCRARRACPVCVGSLRPRRGAAAPTWECAACGWYGAPHACSRCGAEATAPLAAGAGRLAQELQRSHPEAEVIRMEGFDAPGPTRRPAIAVLTRGSVVTRPAWLRAAPADLVVLPDADAFLGRAGLEAAEDGLRLLLALVRWAAGGRHGVVVQTREPRHHAVQALVRWDPVGFWEREAPRRAELRYPPAATLVRLTAPPAHAAEVVAELRGALPADDLVLGPDPSGALLVKTSDLRGTLSALTPLRHAWSRSDRRVRVDVEPATAD